MISKEIEDALLEKCRALAMWQLYNTDKPEYIKEIWSSDDREELAQEYFSITREWFVGEDDPWLVVRAVGYFTSQVPPDDPKETQWITRLWACFYPLVRPGVGTGPEGEPFFEDIRKGMTQAEEWGRQG
jgi:hypothetical protein